MAKNRSKYTCEQCGYVSPQYLGKCPECEAWNTFVESVDSPQISNSKLRITNPHNKPQKLSSVTVSNFSRIPTGISELDHVLNGGLVPGQVVLLAGEPGVGKSTLLLQICEKLGGVTIKTKDEVTGRRDRIEQLQNSNSSLPIPYSQQHILYASGEESVEQIMLRAKRLGITQKNAPGLELLSETNVEAIIGQMASSDYNLAVVDSIQTAWTESLTGGAGSVGQVRECAYQLIQFAKQKNIPVIIVGQVTKEGTVAGPKVLEHLVDTVLYMEGSQHEEMRLLTVAKNRFGSTDEVGVFHMKETGLIEVTNPSEAFVTKRDESLPGQATVVVAEGTRPLLVEVQALVAYSELKSPRRVGSGVNMQRLLTICAILTKHLHLSLESFDVYVNVTGGMKITEPAADLGIALAIYSSMKNKAMPLHSVAIGELSLLGEVKPVTHMERRVKEAKKLGFSRIYSYKTSVRLSDFVKKT